MWFALGAFVYTVFGLVAFALCRAAAWADNTADKIDAARSSLSTGAFGQRAIAKQARAG